LHSNRTVAFRRTVMTCGAVVFLLAWTFVGCWKRQLEYPSVSINKNEKPGVRVLLFDKVNNCTLKSAAGFLVTDGQSNTSAHFISENTPVSVSIANGQIAIGTSSFSGEILVTPDNHYVMAINDNYYRGSFRIILSHDRRSLRVINVLDIEAYLAGVVGAEMPSYWDAEALKTQAVAARTYCLYIAKRFGTKRQWDVKATQANQVYRGLAAERATILDAVRQTEGMVLLCRHENGEKGIFPTYYSSTCGGHTENSRNVFGDSFEPLRGVDCPYCKKIARKSYLKWPVFEIDIAEASSKLTENYSSLKRLKTVIAIEETEVSQNGPIRRINRVKIIGKDGTSDWLRGEDLRLTLDPTGMKLKSTACRIEKKDGKFRFHSGTGFGHGVGMCQYGALGQARHGTSFDKILSYYYPGSWLVKAY